MKAMWTMMAGSLLTLVTFGAGFICGGLLVYDVEKYCWHSSSVPRQ